MKRISRTLAPFLLVASATSAQAQTICTQAEDLLLSKADLQPSKRDFKRCARKDSSPLCGTSRVLSANERAFLHGFFGDQIDTDGVTVHYSGPHAKFAAVATDRKNFIMYGNDMTLADYSLDMNDVMLKERLKYDPAFLQAILTFLHENMHIWQFQKACRDNVTVYGNLSADPESDIFQEGDYVVPEDMPELNFMSYDGHQQAKMIEDYFTIAYVGQEFLRRGFRDANPRIYRAAPKVVEMVEAQFPQAKKTREAFYRINSAPDAGLIEPPPILPRPPEL